MHPVLAFLRMDLSVQRRTLASLGVVGILLLVLARFGGTPPGIALLMASTALPLLLPSQMFAVDERGRLAILWATLPISRRQVVLGRHLSLVLLLVSTTLACGATSWVLTVAAPTSAALPLLPSFGAAFALVSFLMAVQVPIYFAVGSARVASFGTAAVFLVIFLVAGAIGRIGRAPAPLVGALAWPFMPVAAVLVGLALMAASAAVSVPLYVRRAL